MTLSPAARLALRVALGVVLEAGEADEGAVSGPPRLGWWAGDDLLDQVLPGSHAYDLSGSELRHLSLGKPSAPSAVVISERICGSSIVAGVE